MKLLAILLPAFVLAAQPNSFDEAQAFLKTYCQACHSGKAAVGGFHLEKVGTQASFLADTHAWTRLRTRIENGDMPPRGLPAPTLPQREGFTKWVNETLHTEACATGISIGPNPLRRLNRDEYTATVQDLLDIHLDIGHALPADGAGGEGFDNAAETLFLSPLHSEKYLETAKLATDFAAKEFKSRERVLIAKPGPGLTADQAARRILAAFLPRAFRRPVNDADLAPYLELFRAATRKGEDFEPAIFFAIRASLVSPNFLFRVEPGQYALASRLSYFLWGSLPDELLIDLAAQNKLQNPEVLKPLIGRMMRSDRSMVFAKRFIEQWLHTRDLTDDRLPKAGEELRGDMRIQPVMFFRELILRKLSLLNLIDSQFTIGSKLLATHFGLKLPLNPNAASQPQWVALPEGSNRGGILGMPAVLTVSSYPYRTSPVLRGAFILDSILGTPPPPPPPNVPALPEATAGAAPKSVRERLTLHRANPVCASCHDRIDPLGFALENYDEVGAWRDSDAGAPIDKGGLDRLKLDLTARKDVVLRNLANKLLGYALGRGLTLKDSCTVDQIVDKVKQSDYRADSLIEAIVLSAPFRQELK